ncbi:signal peptidase II [bacterium]|nr:signal peptidase II [bacterium]
MKRDASYLILIGFLFLLDQITKMIVAHQIIRSTTIPLIPGFFNLTHIQNKGAIFGIFSQSPSLWLRGLLTLASLGALILVVYYFIKVPPSLKFFKISLSLIMAGALGNFFDRVFRGYVIDFLDFYVGRWHWPSFNVADSCVTVGAVLMVYLVFFRREEKCILSS